MTKNINFNMRGGGEALHQHDSCWSIEGLINDLFQSTNLHDIKTNLYAINNQSRNILSSSCNNAGNLVNFLNLYERLLKENWIAEPIQNIQQLDKSFQKEIQQKRTQIRELKTTLDKRAQQIQDHNEKIQKFTESIRLQEEQIAQLKGQILQTTKFTCLKKGKGISGWNRKELTLDNGQIMWLSESGREKNLVLDKITDIELHIKGKDNTGDNISLQLKHLENENENDLFYLYGHVLKIINPLPLEGGKRISHYKNTKKKKFNSKRRFRRKQQNKNLSTKNKRKIFNHKKTKKRKNI